MEQILDYLGSEFGPKSDIPCIIHVRDNCERGNTSTVITVCIWYDVKDLFPDVNSKKDKM